MKTIHTLQIIDKSTSMAPYRSRTIEGVNDNINTLKKEVDENTRIINTQLQFSAQGNYWFANAGVRGASQAQAEQDFVFKRVGQDVKDIVDMTEADYDPHGNTPLCDAIGYGIEKIKEFHGDKLGDENLKILVTVFTDGEENSSSKWTRADIKKMIDHFQSDGKWTFTFVGCGSFDKVTDTAASYGVYASNTCAVADSDDGRKLASLKISTSYANYARSVKCGSVDNDLFTEKAQTPSK